MPRLAATFPGQGSQYVGMGKALIEQFPSAKLVFEEAEDAIGLGLRKLCFDGSEEQLRLTANTQPAILAHSIAQWRVLQAETGLNVELFMGHSLGEYSALVAAGRLSLSTAVRLVRRRGEEMQQAVPEGLGAMAAVLSCSIEQLQQLCKESSTPAEHVAIANYNSPAQLVVAGHKVAVDKLTAALTLLKIRFVLLPVSAPFHSTLMGPAKKAMRPVLESAELVANETLIVPNLDGKVTKSYGINYLIEQIDHPVLWLQAMLAAKDHGTELYLEVGPAKVLTGLCRRCLPRETRCLSGDDTPETIKALKEILA